MIQYDPNIIYEFATRLYKQAKYIIATYIIVGVFLGAPLGSVVGYYIIKELKSGLILSQILGGTIGLIFGSILGGIIGYAIGVEKVFELKLKAQTALCQLKIEENTRK